MLIDRISSLQQQTAKSSHRPQDFGDFIGQESIKEKLQTAIHSAHGGTHTLWHVLFSGESGYGKTTLASLVAHHLWAKFIPVTGYAFSKPAEMISVLNTLSKWDILFIDEIHRLRPQIEEMLYIAMEDYCIDMVMPEWGSVRIPLQPFTLIWATTKLQSLSSPLKNRFIYKFHLSPYTVDEHQAIIANYLSLYGIELADPELVSHMSSYFPAVPREIHNTCIQLRDWISTQNTVQQQLTHKLREQYRQRSQLKKWGLTPLHQQYLDILAQQPDTPCGLNTLAARLWLHTDVIEQDLEPLLFQLWKISKTPRGRILSTNK